MPNNNTKKTEDEFASEDITAKRQKSEISEFVARDLPNEEELLEFDEMLDEEEREEEIEESLSEIYSEEDKEDIGKMKIKKKRGFLFWFSLVVFTSLLFLAGYLVYFNFFHLSAPEKALTLSVNAPDKILAGEEFFYEIKYENKSKIRLRDITLEAVFPENFIVLEYLPEPSLADDEIWQTAILPQNSSKIIRVKGKILDKKDSFHNLTLRAEYTPENFSSKFKEESNIGITISGSGLNISFDYPSTAFVGESNEVEVEVSAGERNFLPEITVSVPEQENLEDLEFYLPENSELFLEKKTDTSVLLSGFDKDMRAFNFKYAVKEKKEEEQVIKVLFEVEIPERGSYLIYEEDLKLDIMKSDLNLDLIINGSQTDGAVKFGERLNYSVNYANKGESAMEDVVIMAVLEGDFFDWTTLEDGLGGIERGNTITWTKEQIPELSELGVNEDGVIDFSINVGAFRDLSADKDFSLKNYAQFSIGNIEDFTENKDNRSNEIELKINSDLSLEAGLRYFNEDNIPVGSGPLPPEAGEETTLKAYWTISNNLHELGDLRVEMILPEYVGWGDKFRSSAGELEYNENERKIVWNIGRLPTSVYKLDAEFDVVVSPKEEDVNKIIVILPEARAIAEDKETGESLEVFSKVKTSKLEDDEIADMNSDGRVR